MTKVNISNRKFKHIIVKKAMHITTSLPLKIGQETGIGILLFFVSMPNLSSVTGVSKGA